MVTTGWRALGTSVVIGVADPAALDRARGAVSAEVDALDLACSRFRDDSDLSRLNAAAGTPVLVTPLLAEAIRVALRAARLTDGDVDPTVGASMAAIGYDGDFDAMPRDRAEQGPHPVPAGGWRRIAVGDDPALVTIPSGVALDLGATAKALGADRAAAAAHAAAGCGVLVSLGGDMAVAGPAPAGGWPVRVTDDHGAAPDAEGQMITLTVGGLATSSSTVRRWRRGGVEMHHIVDPRTGRPASSPYRTISAAAASCVDANIATTAALVRGERAPEWLRSTGLPCRLVAHDGTVTHLNGWPESAEVAA